MRAEISAPAPSAVLADDGSKATAKQCYSHTPGRLVISKSRFRRVRRCLCCAPRRVVANLFSYWLEWNEMD
jgi:hypothetical protein